MKELLSSVDITMHEGGVHERLPLDVKWEMDSSFAYDFTIILRDAAAC